MAGVDQLEHGLQSSPAQLKLWSKIKGAFGNHFGSTISFNSNGVLLPLSKIGWHGVQAVISYDFDASNLSIRIGRCGSIAEVAKLQCGVAFESVDGRLIAAMISTALESAPDVAH